MDKRSGWLYVVHIANTQFYKIGISTSDIAKRIGEIKRSIPYDVEAVFISDFVENVIGVERYWHRYFRDRRVKGEWYRLYSADIDLIKMDVPIMVGMPKSNKVIQKYAGDVCECGCNELVTTRAKYASNAHKQRAYRARKAQGR